MVTDSAQVLEAARDATRDVIPGFVPHRVIARSVKTHLVLGTLRDGREVVAKVLSNPAPHWRWYLSWEIALYGVFHSQPPPVRVPALLAADAEQGVLVLEHCRGRLLSHGRNAAARVGPRTIETLTAGLLDLSQWPHAPRAPGGAEGALDGDRGPRARALPNPRDTVAWLGRCVDRWRERGLLEAETCARLGRRLARPVELGFAHGDLLLRNVIEEQTGLALVDWEFAGKYPFGWDLGLLWVGLGAAQRSALERIIDVLPLARGEQVRLCALLAAARELEVRRVSLRQGPEHPLVLRLERDLEIAGERWT
jgi:hypothetical protein